MDLPFWDTWSCASLAQVSVEQTVVLRTWLACFRTRRRMELQARFSSDFVANENVQSAIRNVHAMLLKKSALASAVSDRDIPLASSDDSF
ncbi:unnamed protein product [Nesidiocoris tenuis]|uniref:Uncharacterized protein n=1 Tax=Nesidiocoris tenuis TaxID=355587 RepID=A0A6H5GIC9_9HEMI|nr:unnamed protein product [Nesidiocoris tenuis]